MPEEMGEIAKLMRAMASEMSERIERVCQPLEDAGGLEIIENAGLELIRHEG